MRILVTGGCGYIGSHTVWTLRENRHDVVVVDDLSTGSRSNLPQEVELYVADIGDRTRMEQILQFETPDAIIHFAGKILPAESLVDPLSYFEANTSKSIAMLQAMRNAGVTNVIFSSTAAVYAPSAGPVVTEESATLPLTPYGSSKLMVEEVLRAASQAHQIRAIALRYFNVAGVDNKCRCGPSGANPGHLIRTATEVARGEREVLEVYGADYNTRDGTCVRDYIHVSDLATAHLVALDSLSSTKAPPYSVINCGYGRGNSVLEVISAFERVTGCPLPHTFTARRAGDAPSMIANAEKLRQLGWTPRNDNLDSIVASALLWSGAHRRPL